jgi:hypothetical protein
MKWIKTFETKYTETDAFKLWFNGSKVINADGTPKVVYHGTDKNFKRFSSKFSAMGGIIWFTTDKSAVERGEVGAAGSGYIKELYISMKNPAGWEEYEKYTLGQLENLGYDGAILPDNDNKYDGFVFNTNQIRIAR